jgi:ankyrin repeat protein
MYSQSEMPAYSKQIVSPLGIACLMGDYECAATLIERGARCWDFQVGLVGEAARGGNARIVDLLVRNGASVDGENGSYQNPPLVRLSCTPLDDWRMAECLLKHGAYPDIMAQNGVFPLYCAAQIGNVQMMKSLLEYGARINMTTPRGNTALMNACDEGETQAVKLLLDEGADASLRNAMGKTCMDFARQNGYGWIVQLLNDYGVRW